MKVRCDIVGGRICSALQLQPFLLSVKNIESSEVCRNELRRIENRVELQCYQAVLQKSHVHKGRRGKLRANLEL